MVMYLCHLAFVGNGSQHKSSSILAWLVLQRLKKGQTPLRVVKAPDCVVFSRDADRGPAR